MKLGLRRRRWRSGRGKPTGSDRAIVRARWDVACQNRCLASRASGKGGPRVVIPGAYCVEMTVFFGRSRERAGGGSGHMRCWLRSTVCPEAVVRQG